MTDHRTLGRRTLVRSGATAAWTAPIIVAATAAPALAATVPAGVPVMRFSTAPYAVPTIDNAINVVATLSNDGPVEATALVLTLVVTPGDLADYGQSTAVCDALATDPAFGPATASPGTAPGGRTFVLAATRPAPAFTPYGQFEITVKLRPDEIGVGTVMLRADPGGGGTPAVGSATFTFSVLG